MKLAVFVLSVMVLSVLPGPLMRYAPAKSRRIYVAVYSVALAMLVGSNFLPGQLFDGSNF